jgi:hypothetical protein
MSMIGCFRTATDTEIAALLEKPQRILRVFDLPDPQPKGGLLSRLLWRTRRVDPADDWQPDSDNEDWDLDKAWHGIHFLLTGQTWDGEPPLNFIVAGGKEIGKVEVGYGPARCFTSREAAAICDALEPITAESLRERCDRDAFMKHDIYPNIWDEPADECFGYVLTYFEEMKEFMRRTKASRKGLIVSFS